jgi:hypothetical protein
MWLITGIVLGVALLGLVVWMRNKKMFFTWYEWLIGIVGLLLLLFTIQNFFGSLVELENTAAWMFLLVTGLPGLLFLGIVYGLVLRRQRAT